MSYVLEFEKPILELEKKVAEMKALAGTLELDEQIADLERRIEELRAEIYSKLTRWQRVQIARHPERPYTLDYLAHSFDEFIELHGDRCFRDDPAIVGGLARIGEFTVVAVGHQKGRDKKIEPLPQLWNAQSRRLPQSCTTVPIGGKIRAPGRDVPRHPWCVPRN